MTSNRTKSTKELSRRLTWEEIDRGYLNVLAAMARNEDLGKTGLATAPEQAFRTLPPRPVHLVRRK